MNIKRHNINSLLKLTLIFGIIFGAVNSVSAQQNEENRDKQSLNKIQEQSNKKVTENKTNTNDLNQETLKGQTKQEQSQESTDKSDSSQSRQSVQNEDNKEPFTKKDSLIFIDLPILTTLLLLWFLTQKKQQQQIDKLTNNQNKIISKFNQLSELDNKLSNLDRTSRQIIEKIQDCNQTNIDLGVRLHELLSKQQSNQSVNDHNSLTLDTSNLNSTAIVDKISQFVESYNQDKNSIFDKAKAMVAETQASLNQRRSGSSDVVTLENIVTDERVRT
jgi:hypothetical protein